MPYPTGLTLSDEERAKLGKANPGGPVKECEVRVTFPDGTGGTCRYERLGPAYHRFEFRYGDGDQMPRQYHCKPLEGTVQEAADPLAAKAFSDAAERERRDYFARVTEPTSGARKPDPSKFRMEPGKAKSLGGRYALCMPIGRNLIMVGGPYVTLEEANAAFRVNGSGDLAVACCNRMDRCWELPKYNPLYAETGFPAKGGR